MPGPTPEQFSDIARTQSRITGDNIIIMMSMSDGMKGMPHGIDAVAQADQNVIELKFNPRVVENSAICPSLAHEYGHILSFRAGTMRKMKPTDNMLMNMHLPLAMLLISEEGWQEIVAEEIRAWDHARAVLESIDYKDWAGFDSCKEICLGTYYTSQKEALGLSAVQKEHIRIAVLEDFTAPRVRGPAKPVVKTMDIDLDKFKGAPNVTEMRDQITEEVIKILQANGLQ